ncbi:ankyrin repeat, SAM and basic leucine zipper domain-containing protein 1-like [Prorops nasuta]|uniref:ankyrin repeat, SAM and basic leucine zipper domain-containing protein 1-like n=1 Tax=Prorops nasuta TaxID=863751 RepID=UPI0034CD2CCC
MITRPAGMSDEDEDEKFTFDEPIRHKQNRPGKYFNSKSVSKKSLQKGDSNDDKFVQINKISIENSIINDCTNGELNAVKEYIVNHDVNEFLYTGWTLLLYACLAAKPNIVEYLLTHGADPNKHKDGYTPLISLCNSQNISADDCFACLRLLIEAKANANDTNKLRETPLICASKSKNIEFLSSLMQHVKDINATDSEGRTALMYATIANRLDTVCFLLENNARIDIKDNRNLTAADIASAKEYHEIFSVLSSNKEEAIISCSLSKIEKWQDIFPSLNIPEGRLIYDILIVLDGMGLQMYSHLFQNMTLAKFLQLTEEDLLRLGIMISIHRKRFLDCLYKFHSKLWNAQTLKLVHKSDPFSIYNGIMSLGNAATQLHVIGASLNYVINDLKNSEMVDEKEKRECQDYLNQIDQSLASIKRELNAIKRLAKKIDRKDYLDSPASYIAPKKTYNWWPIIGIALTTAIILVKKYAK